jgi:AcrR family transcriptional regulator
VSDIASEQAGMRSHARRNHELLVVAAREVFAERGVEASLEEIARRAGVGVGTLYRHFPNRDALVEAVFERRIGEFVAIAEAAVAEPDGWAALTGMLEGTLAVQAGDRMLKDVFLRSPPDAGPVHQARAEMRRLFEAVLERAHAQGSLRDDFAFPDLALLFWSFAPLMDATADAAPNAWRRHLHWLLDGLRADAASPPPEPPLTPEQFEASVQELRRSKQGRGRASETAEPR